MISKTYFFVSFVAVVLVSFLSDAQEAKDDKAFASFQKQARKAAKKFDVRILRDTWGVPHVFGKRDPDAAFGLAYAHAEDDWGTLEDLFIMTRALGGSIHGADAAIIDFMIHLMRVREDIDNKYTIDLSRETRALCEGYAAGLNYYAALHPDEVVLRQIFPITGKDIVAGFVFRSPFFYGLDGVVQELFGPERRHEVSEKRASLPSTSLDGMMARVRSYLTDGLPTGSNTFSVSPKRSADGSTFLNVNAHQPWTGPVAWYEAHVHSEDGWDMVGGTFPGAPLILHGHNRDLGWAHTVNKPDLVDIYVLEMNPDDPNQYLFDGEWRDLEVGSALLSVKILETSDATMKVRRELLRSVHGPVVRQAHGVYAIRYAGMGDIRHVEQWYRMNKATNLDEWLDAMKMRALASFNCGYADKEGNILYLYNALIPVRSESYDWSLYLPGDTPDTLWQDYISFDQLPMVLNPPSGFVQNCNSSPFQTTFGAGNPDPAQFSPTFGIETHMTNRALRALELFAADSSITESDFYAYKYDMKYSEKSFVGQSIDAIKKFPVPDDADLREAVELLRSWDLGTNPENEAAALGIMAIQPLFRSSAKAADPGKLLESLREAADNLRAVHGRIDVPWEDVNRIHRGSLDIGVGGGPDILHAVYGGLTEDKAHYVGRTGDSYVMLVRWDAQGRVSSRSIHQFGSATLDETSPHYADQTPLFAARELKPVWFDETDIRAHLEEEYRPGEEL